MKTSPRVRLTALAAGFLLFVAIHAALGWRGFAQIKERKNPTPTPTPQPVRAPTPIKVIRPTPTPRPRPAPTPPLATLSSFSFGTEKLNGNGIVTHLLPGQAFYFVVELGGGVTLEMVEIPGGSFMMGAPEAEAGRHSDEGPPHRVDVPSFWIGKFEVTQAQWKAVMGRANRSHFKGDELPVDSVSWNDAQEFLSALNRKLGLQNKGRQYQYRLPSEAEWEYAARAGTTTPFAFGETITPQIVNYDGDYPYASSPRVARDLGTTIAVGSLGVANAFGLFDMHGNVSEWCEDVYHEDYNGAPTDGSAWLNGGAQSWRMMRGGSWSYEGTNCRSAKRGRSDDVSVRNTTAGFRVVFSASALHGQSRHE